MAVDMQLACQNLAPGREFTEDRGNRLAMRSKANRRVLVPLHFATGNRGRPRHNASHTDAATNNSCQRLRIPRWPHPKSTNDSCSAGSRKASSAGFIRPTMPVRRGQHSCYVLRDCIGYAAQTIVGSTYGSHGSFVGSRLASYLATSPGMAMALECGPGSGPVRRLWQVLGPERQFLCWCPTSEHLRPGQKHSGIVRGCD